MILGKRELRVTFKKTYLEERLLLSIANPIQLYHDSVDIFL